MSRPAAMFLGAGIGCLIATAAIAGTGFWFERVYLPRIVGEE